MKSITHGEPLGFDDPRVAGAYRRVRPEGSCRCQPCLAADATVLRIAFFFSFFFFFFFKMLHQLHPRSQASSPPGAMLWCPLCQRLARWIRESAEPNVVSRLSEFCQRLCVASARAGIAQSGYAAWAT